LKISGNFSVKLIDVIISSQLTLGEECRGKCNGLGCPVTEVHREQWSEICRDKDAVIDVSLPRTRHLMKSPRS